MRMRDLKNQYFDFLPVLAKGSIADTEPLQHAIFTYGDLRNVLEAQRRLDEIVRNMAKES